MCVLVICWFN